MKYFLPLLYCFLLGCENLKVAGNYSYIKLDNNDQRNNAMTLSYLTELKKDVPIVMTQRVNSDVLLPSKPAFYEGSCEVWFW